MHSHPIFCMSYLTGLLLLSNAVAADSLPLPESVPLPDSGLLMRENRPPAMQPKPQPKPDIENSDAAKPPMSPENNLQITVKKFRFTGNSQFSDDELSALLNSYLGRNIGFKELQAAAKRITEYYHAGGFFLASAYIPVQDIKDGQVEIAILEGRLDASHLTSDVIEAITPLRINHAVLQRFLDAYAEGELLTVDELNHLSLLINDLPGIKAKIVLMPGTKRGTSTLGVKVKQDDLLKGYLMSDNHGLYATGYYRFDGGVSINDAFGFADLLNLRVQSSETGNMVSGSADYQLPINGYGTRLAVNISELHYSLGRDFITLQAEGLARTVGVSLIHPLWLNKQGRLTATARYEHRWMEDNIGLFNSHNHRELNVMNFSLAGNYYDQLLGADAVTQAHIAISAGEVRFNNQEAFNNDQSSGLRSNGGYHKWNWQLNRTQNIVEDISLYANFQGQIASKNLDSSEKFSLGGANAIRAYPSGEGSSDEGWLFNGEARFHLPNLPYVPGYLQLIGFIDSGFARINAQPLTGVLHNSRHLTGYGFGLNLLDAQGFNLRTSMAWREHQKRPTSDATAHGAMLYFQLSKSF